MEQIESHDPLMAIEGLPQWLSAFPGLRSVRDPAWLAAVRASRRLDIPAKTIIVRKGQPCLDFLFLVEGTLRIYETAENGREIVLYRLYGGELCVLTLSSLLDTMAYSAHVVSETAVTVMSMPLAHFKRALADSDPFRTAILSAFSRRLATMMQLMEQVAFYNLDLRLACLLGQLFGRHNTDTVQITHQTLARELGTSREVLSRLLKTFENKGCIRLARGKIKLLSPQTLAHFMQNSPP